MASFESNLWTYLNANLGYSPYPCHVPQDKLPPQVAFTLEHADHGHRLSGSDGLCHATYRFDCWGKSLPDAVTIADNLRLWLDGYAGTMGTTSVLEVVMEDQELAYDADVAASDTGTFNVPVSFRFHYVETIPPRLP